MPIPTSDSCPSDVRDLWQRFRAERAVFDLGDAADLARLRDDVRRIARGMEASDPDVPPPMLWSGIPVPTGPARERAGWCLTISVGGTNTEFLLSRLDGDAIVGLSREGREVRGEELARVRQDCRLITPTHFDVPTGLAFIERIADHIARYLDANRATLEDCGHILLSWGFAHGVYRTADAVLGGLTASTTLMTKDQGRFTEDLADRDVGALFADALAARVGWRRPVTVANDGVMALHYFLTPENRARYARIGLFINGTGTNFALAEPYWVRVEGVVSREGEHYEPLRATGPIAEASVAPPGATLQEFLVNYETGSITLDATRASFDTDRDYPIERNALSGGNAIPQQWKVLIAMALGSDRALRLDAAARASGPGPVGGPRISRLAASSAEADAIFPGVGLSDADRRTISFVADVVLSRSALHAALILAAVTERRGFGRGDGRRADLLGIEGSVWRAHRYPERVREYWERLVGRPFAVDFAWEPSYAASAQGPLWLTILHS